ncbi:MAG: SMI1/KNR4 family protein [Bacteroidetes bacterium]|nr:SMI1/KNR4 family protein [Bacteroidota bacterium]
MGNETIQIGNSLFLLRNFSVMGFMKLGNGTELIGKATHIAPMAWLHSIYPGLNEKEISEVEDKLNIRFDDQFRSFLAITNGLNVFNTTLNIYGLRRNYNRDTDNVWQPFDIFSKNIYERPRLARDRNIFIGSYSADGSLLAIDEFGKAYRCSKDASIVFNTWRDFVTMIDSKIPRLIALFDNNGVKKIPGADTTPSSPRL